MADIDTVRERVAGAKRLAVLTGAGMSAESGVPTFRGPGGLWRNHRAEDLATPEAFSRDPKLVWEWYDMRRTKVAQAAPNAGHHALVALENRLPGFSLITQNVDGLHRLAGSTDPVEMHGNIWKVRCTACNGITEDRRVPIPIPPSCNVCGALLRPHIVWFGESLDADVLERAFAAFEYCDVALIVGTSGVVQPAASLAGLARRVGAFVAEINPEPTPATEAVDVALLGKAGEILPQLVPG
ncbi:MAG: NAD-dependent deacylase [Nitrospirota bacterium]|nr:NAD-dependent deacylase [Nitrospirota bacterium]